MKMQRRQFRIGQLAEKLNIERFVIRFWEKEFSLKSNRSEGGQRFYTQEDLNVFKQIKELLYDKGFTIAGAKKILHKKKNDSYIFAQKTTIPSDNSPSLSKELINNLKAFQKQLLKFQKLL